MSIRKEIAVALGLSAILFASCADNKVVTKSEFLKVKFQMTYDDVVSIVHHDGKILRNDEYLEGGIVANPGETVYFWKNPDGSNMTVAVRGRHVVSAAQWNLR